MYAYVTIIKINYLLAYLHTDLLTSLIHIQVNFLCRNPLSTNDRDVEMNTSTCTCEISNIELGYVEFMRNLALVE